MVTYPAALDLPHALVETVTMLIALRDGDHRCKLRPSGRAMAALVYLRQHLTLAQIAAGFRISLGTAHAYVRQVVALLARRAPGLTAALRGRGDTVKPAHVLVDGTLAECDRVGDGRADYSGKHRRHGVNLQVVTDPTGKILWVSRALPDRTHDLTAARRHRVITTCIRLGVPVLADLGYAGAGGTFAVPRRRRPRRELTTAERSLNRAHARLRYPVERGITRLKTWKILRRARCSPNWLTQATRAIVTLENYR
ncbi:transposase family protein [Streptomyces goshikiensis]|uniref:transposase family protein n=1 Tax=Streptomyces goshikiensis TaxID=1942 RepID=UPI00368C9CF9